MMILNYRFKGWQINEIDEHLIEPNPNANSRNQPQGKANKKDKNLGKQLKII